MNYSRITESVSISHLQKTHIVVIGAGGSFQLIINLIRSGIKHITVLDFDTVDETNLVRQGYELEDIEVPKVVALEKHVKRINPNVCYTGITKNFLEMSDKQLDCIFKKASIILFLTDSFKAQSFGNIIALKYQKPAIWAGYYAKSRTAELFFQIPSKTPACFRCAMSSRYLANKDSEIKVSSNCNTIFHSELLDSFIGMMTLAILHRDEKFATKEAHLFYKSLETESSIQHNFFQFKVHPKGGNPLFDQAFNPLGNHTPTFVSYWQAIEPELKPKYKEDCPDCKGLLSDLVEQLKK